MKKIFHYIVTLWKKIISLFKPIKMEAYIRKLYETEYLKINNHVPYSGVRVLKNTPNGIPIKYIVTFEFVSGAAHINEFNITLEFDRNFYSSLPQHKLTIDVSSSVLLRLTARQLSKIFTDIDAVNFILESQIKNTYNTLFP